MEFASLSSSRTIMPKDMLESRERGQLLHELAEKIDPIAADVTHKENDKFRAVAAVAAIEAQLQQARSMVGQAEVEFDHSLTTLDAALKEIGF
jgi:hypothetical protein